MSTDDRLHRGDQEHAQLLDEELEHEEDGFDDLIGQHINNTKLGAAAESVRGFRGGGGGEDTDSLFADIGLEFTAAGVGAPPPPFVQIRATADDDDEPNIFPAPQPDDDSDDEGSQDREAKEDEEDIETLFAHFWLNHPCPPPALGVTLPPSKPLFSNRF